MNMYIAGDSYCADRTDPAAHWPAHLAQILGLELTGAGFPGLGWWPVRQHLLQYLDSALAAQTDLWVFCHTDPARPLTLQLLSPSAQRAWIGEIEDSNVTAWVARCWYQELNALMQGRRVLHLTCYSQSGTAVLEGLHRSGNLYDLARESCAGDLDLMTRAPNHMTAGANRALAEELAQLYHQAKARPNPATFITQK